MFSTAAVLRMRTPPGYMAPHSVHYGYAKALCTARATTLNAACLARPDRFKGLHPQPHPLPTAAWMNPPLPLPRFLRANESSQIERTVIDALTSDAARLA
jgi:hypothetical protein